MEAQWGKQVHLAVTAFTGHFYVRQEKSHRASQCNNRGANKVELVGTVKKFNKNSTNVDIKDTRKRIVGNCQRMLRRGLVDTS